MDPIKTHLHSIQPAGGTRPADRAPGKDPAQGLKWEQTLQEASAQMDRVSEKLKSKVQNAATADPKTIEDDLRQANEHFQQMMKLQQNLSQLYHQIHKSDSEKA